MTAKFADQIKEAIKEDDKPDPLAAIKAAIEAPSTTEPVAGTPLTGIETLRLEDPDAMRVWTQKLKQGGTIAKVMLQGSNEVVLLETLASGRFTVWAPRVKANE